jgi:hypothetical protein
MVPTIKWLSVASCVVILVATVASDWWQVGYCSIPSGLGCVVCGGGIGVWSGEYLTAVLGLNGGFWTWRGHFGLNWVPRIERINGSRLIYMPLWMIALVPAVIALYCWRRERRRPRYGHCQACGYNLTGNVTGRCPECGTVIGKPQLNE